LSDQVQGTRGIHAEPARETHGYKKVRTFQALSGFVKWYYMDRVPWRALLFWQGNKTAHPPGDHGIQTTSGARMMKPSAAVMDMDMGHFQAVHTFVSSVEMEGKQVLRVTKDPAITEVDEATFARWVGAEFHNGSIELEVLSRLLPDAPDYARGFIGIAFRIDEENSRFEGLYIRPTNGRAEDAQPELRAFRRAHATQYFSYPGYKFDRLRQEAPGKYESAADIGLNEWIRMRIEVDGQMARLFLNGSSQPVLSVNDLKHGPDLTGGIGLWVDIGTQGFFREGIVRYGSQHE
jgi:hypothetical protein